MIIFNICRLVKMNRAYAYARGSLCRDTCDQCVLPTMREPSARAGTLARDTRARSVGRESRMVKRGGEDSTNGTGRMCTLSVERPFVADIKPLYAISCSMPPPGWPPTRAIRRSNLPLLEFFTHLVFGFADDYEF